VSDDFMTPALARWRRWTDLPLTILAIGSIPLLLLELARKELPYVDRMFLDTVNVVVLVAFAVNDIVEIMCVRNRSQYVRHEWISPLLIASQALALVPALAPFGILRGLRGFVSSH
jgi:hypothetical protein